MTSLFETFPLPWRAQVLGSGDRVAVIARNGRRVTEISPGQFHGHDLDRAGCELLAEVIVTAVNAYKHYHGGYSPNAERAAIIEDHTARHAADVLHREAIIAKILAHKAQCCGDAKPGENILNTTRYHPSANFKNAAEVAEVCGELEDGA